jgi:hypothetical protein
MYMNKNLTTKRILAIMICFILVITFLVAVGSTNKKQNLGASNIAEKDPTYMVNGEIEANSMFNKAIANNDVSICDKIYGSSAYHYGLSDSMLSSRCYSAYVKALPEDQGVCTRILSSSRLTDVDYKICITDQIESLAQKMNNVQICQRDGIYNASSTIDLCILRYAYNKNNTATCTQIENPSFKKDCVKSVNEKHPSTR